MNNFDVFVSAAKSHESAIKEGNHEKANQAYSQMKKIVETWEGAEKLIGLLDYNDAAVQIWAASFLVDVHPEVAKKTLEELATMNVPFHSFSARMILEDKFK